MPGIPPRINVPKTPSVPPRTQPFAKAPVSPAPVPPRPSAPAAPAQEGKGKTIQIKPPIIVRDFAKALDIKSFRLISELMDMGIFASMNQAIEEDIAIKIAKKHGFELDIKRRGEQHARQLEIEAQKLAARKAEIADEKNLEPRPPIVCILGHVDHGKTTLLDTIRKTNVVAGEAGGITQHTAAYQVELNGKKITFLDTPGHAAFSKMRERGANITDIAILVVAADDGFMPQTDEALSFAQKAGVPVVVAINKMDAKGANIDKVKQQMQKRGIAPEDWGGETLCCGISALKGEHIDELLELVLLQAEIMELKANPKRDAKGVVIESQIEQGRGSTATVIIRAGTLKPGDVIVSKGNWCKVRAMLDDKGGKIQKAPPSTPALVMGWTGAPEAGDEFEKVANDR
ncbi:MAG: translation initiation factor IF-2, partial [Opitutales bacterium]|nr:translation initiation factor IF-2 [Opitutales bacterium]